MIDGIKCLNVNAEIAKLKNNPLLEWKFNSLEGEILNQYCLYRGLKLEIKRNLFQLNGSLHKYKNNGIHNYNDFSFPEIKYTINELEETLNLNQQTTPLNNIEFGVNIIIPLKPKDFIKRIISHKGKRPNIETSKDNMYYLQFNHGQYIIKIYDKGLQYGLDENVMRFEIKVTKMQFLKDVGLVYLSDLLKPCIYVSLGNILLKIWGEILVYDPDINSNSLTKRDKDLYLKGCNPLYWESLYELAATNGSERGKRDRALLNFRKIILRNGNKLPETIGKIINNKWSELSKPKLEICNKLSLKKRSHLPLLINLKPCIFTTFPIGQKIQIRANLHFKYKVDSHVSLKTCIITGEDISRQKKESKFLSEKTLNDNPDIEKKLSEGHRKNKRKCNCSNGYYSAHNLRNKDSNPRNNFKRRYNKLIIQPMLFATEEIIKLTDQQREYLK